MQPFTFLIRFKTVALNYIDIDFGYPLICMCRKKIQIARKITLLNHYVYFSVQRQSLTYISRKTFIFYLDRFLLRTFSQNVSQKLRSVMISISVRVAVRKIQIATARITFKYALLKFYHRNPDSPVEIRHLKSSQKFTATLVIRFSLERGGNYSSIRTRIQAAGGGARQPRQARPIFQRRKKYIGPRDLAKTSPLAVTRRIIPRSSGYNAWKTISGSSFCLASLSPFRRVVGRNVFPKFPASR